MIATSNFSDWLRSPWRLQDRSRSQSSTALEHSPNQNTEGQTKPVKHKPAHRVVFNEVVERVMHKVPSTKQIIAASAGVDQKMLELCRSVVSLVRTPVWDDVTPDLITHTYQERPRPFPSQLVLCLVTAYYSYQKHNQIYFQFLCKGHILTIADPDPRGTASGEWRCHSFILSRESFNFQQWKKLKVCIETYTLVASLGDHARSQWWLY